MLPNLKASRDNVTMVNTFLGLNKGPVIKETEFSDMRNMTNDYYPVMASRKQRGLIRRLTKPQGILGGKYLSYVDDNKLYYDESFVMQLEETDKERKMVQMGALLCVFPDGVVYNTNTKTIERVRNKRESAGTVTMRMCKLDGTEFTDKNTHIGTTEPQDKSAFPYWLDTSGSTVILKMWSPTYAMWTSVATTYVKISATGIGTGFKDYDAVTFSGITIKGYNDYDFNKSLIVYKAAEDYMIVAGMIDLYHTQTETVTAERKLPDMDYVCELDNRIWGCSSDNHEIYACKLGDPTNWNCYAGLNSDSYAATVGSQDDFTGCCSYGGYVYFFKEDGYHKLYGTKPADYTMVWKSCRGVQKGSDKSIAIVNDVMIFKSRDAIVAYDGSQTTISEKLGVEPYYEAVAIGYRNKYYVAMRDVDYNYLVYVYDITKGTWNVEDEKMFRYAAYADNGAYFVDKEYDLYVINNEKIYMKYFPSESDLEEIYMFPNDGLYPGNIASGKLEDIIDWSITTGDIGLDNPYRQYLKRLNIRMQLEANSKVLFEIEYDSSGEWEYITEYYTSKKRSCEIPIAVKRSDHVRLRISGRGFFRLFSIAKAVETGSGVDGE